MNSNPEINIIILNWNGDSVLDSCIDSVSSIHYLHKKLWLVDNGSSDNSAQIIEKYKGINLIKYDTNYGFAKGYNKAVSEMPLNKQSYLMFLNNDTVVDKNILNPLIESIQEFGDRCIYGPLILYDNSPDTIWYGGGYIDLDQGIIKHIGLRQNNSINLKREKTDYITGCCMVIHSSVFKELGGFNESLGMYNEDVDLCLRAKNIGVNCIFVPESKVHHKISHSLGGNLSIFKIFYKFLSTYRLFYYHNIPFRRVTFIKFIFRSLKDYIFGK